MSAIDYSFIGLPKSGKTSFLAALWHLIESGEIASKLTLEKLEGDQTHLTNLANLWRSGTEIPRTSTALEATVKIHIKEVATERSFVLSFPDIDGETFEGQIETRTCKQEFFDSIEGNPGIFLFVTANGPMEPLSLGDLHAALPTEDEATNDEEKNVESARNAWTHKNIPFQVKVVELLQFLQTAPFKPTKRKVSIMISAWDVVTPKCTPSQWLATKMPLLDQFLKSNPELFAIKLYGISALGGDIEDDDTRNELLRRTPSERMACECDLESTSDITIPIAWMMAET